MSCYRMSMQTSIKIYIQKCSPLVDPQNAITISIMAVAWRKNISCKSPKTISKSPEICLPLIIRHTLRYNSNWICYENVLSLVLWDANNLIQISTIRMQWRIHREMEHLWTSNGLEARKSAYWQRAMWLRSHIQSYKYSNFKIFGTHQPRICPVKSRKSFICRRNLAQVYTIKHKFQQICWQFPNLA